MKVLCIKDTIGFRKWDIYEIKWVHTSFIKGNDGTCANWESNPDFFEEVKEDIKKDIPKWKVWDYVVSDIWANSEEDDIKVVYSTINSIQKDWDFVYTLDWYDYREEELRDPTEEELSFYFK